MPRIVARPRHWKQRFNSNAKFIWRRPARWDGKVRSVGSKIPKTLADNLGKLRTFWEAGWIELAEFEAPNVATGQIAMPAPSPSETATEDV